MASVRRGIDIPEKEVDESKINFVTVRFINPHLAMKYLRPEVPFEKSGPWTFRYVVGEFTAKLPKADTAKLKKHKIAFKIL